MRGSRAVPISLCVLSLLPTNAYSAARSDVLIDKPGVWNLGRLSLEPVTIRPRVNRERVEVRFRLPKAARQGPTIWYRVHLDATVRISRASGEGIAYLSVANNNSTSAQVKIRVQPRARAVIWSTLGLIDGLRTHRTTSREFRVLFDNFIPYAGIRPGPNIMAFQVEQLPGVRIEQVRVQAGTHIEVTPKGPAFLHLSIVPRQRHVLQGNDVTFTVRVVNRGGLAAERVRVGVEHSKDVLRILSGSTRSLGRIGPGQVSRAIFSFEAIEAGDSLVAASASSTANRPGDVASVTVQPRPDTFEPSRTSIAIGVSAIAILTLLGVIIARRSK